MLKESLDVRDVTEADERTLSESTNEHLKHLGYME
jgi:hypothetical protein